MDKLAADQALPSNGAIIVETEHGKLEIKTCGATTLTPPGGSPARVDRRLMLSLLRRTAE